MPETLDKDDIQGLVATGFGSLHAGCYYLLAIDDAAAARRWLGVQADAIASAAVYAEESALNLALTASGLRKLGLAAEAMERFSGEFQAGIVGEHRSRALGDVEESAPELWRWGGPNTPSIDLLLLLFATTDAGLTTRSAELEAGFATGGLSLVHKLDTFDNGVTEHFGFRDGVSQPIVEGMGKEGRPDDTIRAGEFLLGYRNQYELFTDRPLLPSSADPRHLLPTDAEGSGRADFGRNGTYLVFRQLSQDVRGFWRYLDESTRRLDGSPHPAARTLLGAKMVGRWPSGASLVVATAQDDPQQATFNDFAYHATDPDGLACPIGSHVRRTNPRDSLDPQPGTADSIAINKRHRILRRGREYGMPLEGDAIFETGDANETERGLHFICLNANLLRQFEFIQHNWANNPHFAGLYDDADPIAGRHGELGSSFTVPATPVRERVKSMPQFVSTRGGAYFFLPGIRAIRYLASLP